MTQSKLHICINPCNLHNQDVVLLLCKIIMRFISWYLLTVYPFLLMSSMLFYGYTTACLSVYMLMNICVISSLGLLRVKLL